MTSSEWATAYYIFRIALGLIGSLLWAWLFIRAYRSLHSEPVYERRLWTALLVSFPGIYSFGYMLISLYGIANTVPPPDGFPLIVATLVQVIAVAYAIRLLRRKGLRRKALV